MNKMLKNLIVFTLVLFSSSLILNQTASAQHRVPNRGKRAQMKPSDFVLKPVYAQFLDSYHFLRGDSDGLQVINIKSGEVVEELSKGKAISTMLSGPVGIGVYSGTYEGEVYVTTFTDGKVKHEKIKGLEKTPIFILKTILINANDPTRVVFADPYRAVICKMNGTNARVLKTVKVSDQNSLINFAVQDHRKEEFFLLAATNGGKYRVNWTTGDIVEIRDESMPHGYSLQKYGSKFIPIGKNAEFLLTNYLETIPVFMKRLPDQPMSYLLAGIGKGPMRVTVEKNNFYNLQILTSNTMTYSIDIDPANSKNMLISTTDAVRYKPASSRKWKTIK